MSLPDFERAKNHPGHGDFHLERMTVLLNQLGNPHEGIPAIHIAGTKGKGSTAAMLASVGRSAGYKVGLYTSPHLHRIVERIRVGLDPIAAETLASLVWKIWPLVEHENQKGKYGKVTFFEALTTMAFLHFAEIGADLLVIEVGLGGRLDSTNVVIPKLCAITRISLDHVSILGDSIEKIAEEKAGIIKPTIPVVVAPQPREAMKVFEAACQRNRSPLIDVAQDIVWKERHTAEGAQSFQVVGCHKPYNVQIPLMGQHQVDNTCTAIAVLELLIDEGYAISTQHIEEGLAKVVWPARMQILNHERCKIVADGAHNPDSVSRLMDGLHEHFEFERAILVFGATRGHNPKEMLEKVVDSSPVVVPVQSRHPKAIEAQEIWREAVGLGLSTEGNSGSVAEGTQTAIGLARKGDLIAGTGSLSVAAEVIEEVYGIEPELYPEMS